MSEIKGESEKNFDRKVTRSATLLIISNTMERKNLNRVCNITIIVTAVLRTTYYVVVD